MLKNKKLNISEDMKRNNLSTTLYVLYQYINKSIGMIYLKMKTRLFLIPELIFFESGLYAANILSKIDLLNGAIIPLPMIVKIIVVMSLLSISYNLSEIIKAAIKWWRLLK